MELVFLSITAPKLKWFWVTLPAVQVTTMDGAKSGGTERGGVRYFPVSVNLSIVFACSSSFLVVCCQDCARVGVTASKYQGYVGQVSHIVLRPARTAALDVLYATIPKSSTVLEFFWLPCLGS
jgi:hypothetical protein